MSSPPSPLVWFLLLDSATGEPYKETSADKVSVSSSADVADFRDAVKKKDKDDGDAAVLTPFNPLNSSYTRTKLPLTRETLPSMKKRKNRSKKTLLSMVSEHRRKKPSLSSSHHLRRIQVGSLRLLPILF
jgi:hypothetical protein